MNTSSTRLLHIVCTICCLLVGGRARAETISSPPPVSPDQVLARMEQRFLQQMHDIQFYEARRNYRASNLHLNTPALWKVDESYHAPGVRILHVRERSGPRFLERVLLDRILAVESETATESVRRAVDLNRDNYRFRFLAYDPEQDSYRFEATPLTEHPYLFRGTVWINGDDFGVERIEGSPAGKTSYWVRETHFVHEFARFGDYWFPVHHRSVARRRWFEEATLEVTYSGYRWTIRR